MQLIKGNTFAGTAFFSYGAFWMAFFVTNVLVATAPVNATTGVKVWLSSASFKAGQTLILGLWGLFTFGFFVPTLRKNGCLMTSK
jgi:succinate-acetate transporter protein